MRPLAHIEKLVKTYPIKNADNIEMVQLLDFHVVVKKTDNFKKDDLVLYIEIDSILPNGLPIELEDTLKALKKKLNKSTGEDIQKVQSEIDSVLIKNIYPEFEFLRQKKFIIRALKYKFEDDSGNPIISCGIVFPISVLESVLKTKNISMPELSEGLDVTSLLGVEKVIEDVEEIKVDVVEKKQNTLDKKLSKYKIYRKVKKLISGEKISGRWEDFLAPQSDETNVQKLFTKMKEIYGDQKGWVATSKFEGQNISAYLKSEKYFFNLLERNHFGVCTHHRNLITDDGSRFWQTIKELDFEKKLRAVGKKNIMTRGEHCGGKVQKNIYQLPSHRIFLFEVYDMESKKYYNYEQFMEFCHKYEFEHCPVVYENFALPDTVQEMLKMSMRNDEIVPGVSVMSEGLVVRRMDDYSVSFKVKNPEYLLKGK